jgi:V8-like Glu-specific endopeptidase
MIRSEVKKAALAALATLFALGVLTGSGSAQTVEAPYAANEAKASSDGRAGEPVSSPVAPVQSSRSFGKGFWTRDRMEAAEPLDIVRERIGNPPDTSRAFVPYTSTPYQTQRVPDPTAYPFSTQGKVFFTNTVRYKVKKRVRVRVRGRFRWRVRYRWSDWKQSPSVCSGTIVGSQNKSLVITAGHCLYSKAETKAEYMVAEGWHENVAFVPGYQNGTRPFGVFYARDRVSLRGWLDSENFNYDVGAVVVATNEFGQYLSDVAGSRSISWQLDPNQYIWAYGYPAVQPYNGEDLFVSVTSYGGDDPQQLSQPGPVTSAIGSDQTGGASGGGWIIAGTHILNGVNSYRYDNDPHHMFGPYFGTAIGDLYWTAQD